MVRYVTLIRFTNQGAKNLKKSTARALAFSKQASKAGVNVEVQLWTLGRYDGVLILSAENSKAVLHCLAELTASGNVRTETLLAMDEGEFESIV